MDDVSQSILDTWDKLWPRLKENPDQLRRRLARRATPMLQRPLRHQCIALRASDRRITPMHWIITPSHALDLDHPHHPYEPIEHEVTIQTYALQKFCRPVKLDAWGEDVADVVKQLGISYAGLTTARRQLTHRMIPNLSGKRGKPIPIIHSRRPFDPGSGASFSPPDQILGSLWQYLPDSLPENFEQPVMRTPIFKNMRRHDRFAPPPDDHQYIDDHQLIGWRWICPGCKKKVRTIYYPIRIWNLCDFINFDPAKAITAAADNCGAGFSLQSGEADLPNCGAGFTLRSSPLDTHIRHPYDDSHPLKPFTPYPTFACKDCHQILYFFDSSKIGWNILISHLTSGLLYGHEVPPPSWYKPGQNRKRRRTRRLNSRLPIKRQAILQHLLTGRSNHQIAAEMLISLQSVKEQIRILCHQENVKNRHALALKLGASKFPPLNHIERAAQRRLQVQNLLLAGLSYKQIMSQLNLDFGTVNYDTQRLYKLHGVKGHGLQARRNLAAKLGQQFQTPTDLLRQQISHLHATGQTCKQIAEQLNLPYNTIYPHILKIRRAQLALPLGQRVAVETEGRGEGGSENQETQTSNSKARG